MSVYEILKAMKKITRAVNLSFKSKVMFLLSFMNQEKLLLLSMMSQKELSLLSFMSQKELF